MAPDGSVVNSDGWAGCHGLVDVGYDKHYRVNHGNNEWSDGHGHHINGIENFWNFTKRRAEAEMRITYSRGRVCVSRFADYVAIGNKNKTPAYTRVQFLVRERGQLILLENG